MSTSDVIHEIDFLPAEYRQKRVRLQSQPWRLMIALGLAALVVAAVVCQFQHRRQLEARRAVVAPQYEAAVRQNQRLGELQGQLAVARAQADLITYLRHPWPRTRILDALLAPLPDAITLECLEMKQEIPAGKAATRARPSNDKAAEEALKKLPPAAQDLAQLRQQCDSQQTNVTLTGLATETAALHQYLAELGKSPLFVKAVLADIESDAKDGNRQLRFSARLIVKPGYGQPGGPTPTQHQNQNQNAIQTLNSAASRVSAAQ